MATMNEIYSEIETNLKNNISKNKGVNGVFQFDIGGDDPMMFHFKLEDGAPSISEGSEENPNVTITMESSNFQQMFDGKLKGPMAVMSGKLKIKGDMSLAMKIENIIK